ncbi:MAG: glycosyltransferase family 2 protein [Planctomycetota bacterium]
MMRVLIAVPVYNESKYIERVLTKLTARAKDILIIDDGSTDDTPSLLPRFPVEVIRHAENRGYGRSMLDAFRWARVDHFDWVITMDCDEQHEPEAIPDFMAAIESDQHDVISGSRYLASDSAVTDPPENRRRINKMLTAELNERIGDTIGGPITDAFCGFKAYRVSAVSQLTLTENGYAFPMQFWIQAAANRLRVTEIPVKLIYNDPNRTFGGPLNDDEIRLNHYRQVLHCEINRCADQLPSPALNDVMPCPGKEQAALAMTNAAK